MWDDATMERYWRKVDVRGPNECWPWTASCNQKGYGHIIVNGRLMRAHRIGLILKLGRPIQDGWFACHSCDNPPCCNPAHLWEGTPAMNTRDSVAKGRAFLETSQASAAHLKRTECINGHPYPVNVWIDGRGRRKCRFCQRASERRWYHKQKAAVS